MGFYDDLGMVHHDRYKGFKDFRGVALPPNLSRKFSFNLNT